MKASADYLIQRLQTPIPILTGTGAALSEPDCREIVYDFEHPLAADPLVSVDQYGLAYLSFYAISDGSNSPYNRKWWHYEFGTQLWSALHETNAAMRMNPE